MQLKTLVNKLSFGHWFKKETLWDKYEETWIVLISVVVVVALAFLLRTILSFPIEQEELYIGSESYSFENKDFFVANQKNLKHPLTLLSNFDQYNPFTAHIAAAEQGPSDATTNTKPSNATLYLTKAPEPNIRVGITYDLLPLHVAVSSGYQVQNGNGQPIVTLGADENITLSYNRFTQQYTLVYGQEEFTSDSFLKIVPQQTDGIITLLNYENRPSWNLTLNDNTYRGIVEFRYTPTTNRVWVINEVAMEDYLKGMGETTTYAPVEYLKAMTIAARSYALWHHLDGNKHKGEFFDVHSSTIDQVYDGYGVEQRHEKLVQAVEATRGVVATYNGQLAIIPYFSGSSGQTYSWQQVWGSSKYPWVQGVSVPEETGYTRLGHGVGLSQRGARLMVENGSTVTDIYNHFFTDIELRFIYTN